MFAATQYNTKNINPDSIVKFYLNNAYIYQQDLNIMIQLTAKP